MTITKNQHYVPQVYQRRFTFNETHVFVCDKKTKKTYPDNIENQCSDYLFYECCPYQKINEFENKAAQIEGTYNENIDRLINFVQRYKQVPLQLLPWLRKWMMFQHARTPLALQRGNKMYDETCGEIGQELKGLVSTSKFEEVDKAVADKQADTAYLRYLLNCNMDDWYNDRIDAEFRGVKQFKRWILFDKHERFIYSDNPIYVSKGFNNHGTVIHFPFTPQYCLCLYEKKYWNKAITRLTKDQQVVKASEKNIRIINQLTWDSADKYLYAKSTEPLEWFKWNKYQQINKEWKLITTDRIESGYSTSF